MSFSPNPLRQNLSRKLWHAFPLRSGHELVDVMLLCVPLTFIARYLSRSGPLLTFFFAALSVIPLAGALGESTTALAANLGTNLGALLNATMGNASEFIIGVVLLWGGHSDIVKASLSGSIVCNILLVFGLSAFVGGMSRQRQRFSTATARLNSTLLFVAVVGLITPALFSLSIFGTLEEHGSNIVRLSFWTSIVLITVYLFSLVFTFKRSLSNPCEHHRLSARAVTSSVISLAFATGLLAFVSEILTEEIEQAKRILGWSDLFMGVIVIAILGNVAEHAVAVMMAKRDEMEFALGVSVGSSAQLALFIAPVLVVISRVLHQPMSLIFTPLEIAGIALSVLIVSMISEDGETTWLEGVELVAVYLIFAISAYLLPSTSF